MNARENDRACNINIVGWPLQVQYVIFLGYIHLPMCPHNQFCKSETET